VSECVDYFAGHMLDVALRELPSRVLLELQFISGNETASEDQRYQIKSNVTWQWMTPWRFLQQ
jgi:hypothetical protein